MDDVVCLIVETYEDRDFGEGVRCCERVLVLVVKWAGHEEVVHVQKTDPAIIRGQHRD